MPDPCPHAHVQVIGQVSDTPGPLRSVTMAAVCADCQEPFVFLDLPISFDAGAAGIVEAGLQAHLPMVPRSLVYPVEEAEPPKPRKPELEIIGRRN